jgi:hypothetical protein
MLQKPLKNKKACCEQQAFELMNKLYKAVHKSCSDLCHHHAMFENLTIDIMPQLFYEQPFLVSALQQMLALQ